MIHSVLVAAIAALSFTLPDALTSMLEGPQTARSTVQHEGFTTYSNIVGTHQVYNDDGTPLKKGAVATTVVTSTGFGTFEGRVYLDQGNGPVELESERIVILGGYGVYVWHNTVEGGGSGTISEVDDEHGTAHETNVTEGDNVNKKRRWVRQP